MAKTLPPMLEVMKEIGGVEFPEILGKIGAPEAVDAQPTQAQTEAATETESPADESEPQA
ncbi:MAG: flotillin family protein, partial [Thermoguttaceae bacterium]|nr:flotillin family protein [Thermoguttaceae bacterium]